MTNMHRIHSAVSRCFPSRLLVVWAMLILAAVAEHAQSQSSGTISARRISAVPGLYEPIADPRAMVKVGKARITVLTPQLIRMEWASDGKFEDHASLVFLNRKLPVPKFTTLDTESGGN